jgi:hypothetical protein
LALLHLAHAVGFDGGFAPAVEEQQAAHTVHGPAGPLSSQRLAQPTFSGDWRQPLLWDMSGKGDAGQPAARVVGRGGGRAPGKGEGSKRKRTMYRRP